MRGSVHLVAALSAVLAPAFAQAHFLWATLDPTTKTVAIGLQEVPTETPLPLGERVAKVKAWSPSGKALVLKPDANWLKSPTSESCVGVSLDYGVLDKRDQGRGVFWLRYYAKAATSPEASQTKVGLPVDLKVAIVAGAPVVTVLKDGKPASGAEVTVASPDGSEEPAGKTGSDGTLALPASKGNLAIRAMVAEDTKGTQNGKDYDLVRSYCTLTVAMQGATPAEKTLTQKIVESFGGDHEKVQHTAFIATLLGDSLTKEQWEANLLQRAIVHEELDRILRSASVPYGDEQRQVVTLLRNDLAAMGAKWPDASMAWPETNDLLRQIRESEKQGPYFALGVWHVYYGGITHGGRQIGGIAGKKLGLDPTYYLKSDGYKAYAQKVNEITDPEAQRQMILGGQAAYAYVIATNDAEVFKTK
ncbi:hypothetical protein BH11ARM2_BH11ARM2_21860 [soil metagenome]